MKTRLTLFCASLLITGLDMMLTGGVSAQTFTTLYNFTSGTNGNSPLAGLIVSGNTLYGTASVGGLGLGDYGTVFAINTDGTGFRTLHSFTPTTGYTNSDGYRPSGGLVLSTNILYGTAYYGGNSGNGTVFAINTNGPTFTTLYKPRAIGVEGEHSAISGTAPFISRPIKCFAR